MTHDHHSANTKTITTRLTVAETRRAWDHANQRYQNGRARGARDRIVGSHHRAVDIGDILKLEAAGTLTELAWSKYTGTAWTGSSFAALDDNDDVGHYQLRSSWYPKAHLISLPKDPDRAPIILGIPHGMSVTFVGWMIAQDTRQDRYYRPNPLDDHPIPFAWWVPQDDIRPMTTLS
jgi:hypothetical protein